MSYDGYCVWVASNGSAISANDVSGPYSAAVGSSSYFGYFEKAGGSCPSGTYSLDYCAGGPCPPTVIVT